MSIITFTSLIVNFNCDTFSAMKKIFNERGFLMLDVIFLTVITALAATILMNAAPRIRNSQSTLQLTALYLANEQFAYLESRAASGESLPTKFLGEPEDLIAKNFETGKQIKFIVDTQINDSSNPRKVTITVTIDGRKDFEVKAERMIWLVKEE